MQSRESLDFLRNILGDPVDHSALEFLLAPAAPGTNAERIRGSSGDYAIIDHIPSMRVSDAVLARSYSRRQVEAWKIVQAAGEHSYTTVGAAGNFSTEQWRPALDAGKLLRETIGPSGLVLDVGCGLLPEPAYMSAAGGNITFVGVDPMRGHVERRFPFAECYGDFLPFRPAVFDAVQFISSLDHMVYPLRALRDAFVILKPGGTLLIEETIRNVDTRYRRWWWSHLFGPARYNEFHNFAFTERSLQRVVHRAGFVAVRVAPTSDAREICVVARKPDR